MNRFDINLICPLCGINGVQHNGRRYIAREHIPPRSLFIKGTSDLITIPSCQECNNLTSHHDEEFKISMGLYLGSSAPDFWQDIRQSLNKNEKRRRKRTHIIESMSTTLTKSPTGRWGHKVLVERDSIDLVVTKITKGLHWHFTKNILPSDIIPKIIFLNQGAMIHPETQQILNKYGQMLKVANGNFQAHHAFIPNEKHASLWKLSFYGVDCFLVGIKPKILGSEIPAAE